MVGKNLFTAAYIESCEAVKKLDTIANEKVAHNRERAYAIVQFLEYVTKESKGKLQHKIEEYPDGNIVARLCWGNKPGTPYQIQTSYVRTIFYWGSPQETGSAWCEHDGNYQDQLQTELGRLSHWAVNNGYVPAPNKRDELQLKLAS
jgi:hypothetical protein